MLRASHPWDPFPHSVFRCKYMIMSSCGLFHLRSSYWAVLFSQACALVVTLEFILLTLISAYCMPHWVGTFVYMIPLIPTQPWEKPRFSLRVWAHSYYLTCPSLELRASVPSSPPLPPLLLSGSRHDPSPAACADGFLLQPQTSTFTFQPSDSPCTFTF